MLVCITAFDAMRCIGVEQSVEGSHVACILRVSLYDTSLSVQEDMV